MPVPSDAIVPPSFRPTATVSDVDIEAAVRFRSEFGLRADRAWVAEVAENPSAAHGLATIGVPLLPNELAELEARFRDQRDVVPAILAYGRTQPDAWAGTFIDQAAGGLIVAQFNADVATHRDRLAALLPPGTHLDVRAVRWSRSQLGEFATEIRSDKAWFPTVGGELRAAEIDDEGNLVRVRYRGPESLKPVISEHFGDPPWLHLEASPPRWTGPVGDLVIEIVDPAGSSRAFTCLVSTADVRAPNVELAIAAGDDGRCRVDSLPAVRFLLRITSATEGDEDALVGEGFHLVLPDQESRARVVVQAP